MSMSDAPSAAGVAAETRTAEELARAALPAYGVPMDTELTLLKHRENTVFSFEHGSCDYVLRVHRQGYHTDRELEREIRFVRALDDSRVRVPCFVPGVEGQDFVHVGHDHPRGVHQVDLQRFIPNSGNFGDEHSAFHGTATHSPEDFHRLGELIAEVHSATVESDFTADESRPSWDAEGLVGEDALWGAPLRVAELHGPENSSARRTLEDAIDVVRSRLHAYGQPAHRYGPIHADLTPENVLRTEAGLVLIDFDDFAYGWHLFDLATALYFFTRHPRHDEYRSALFAGYQCHRRLDQADFAAFPAILVARGLTYLGWAADRRGEPTAEFHVHEVLPHLLELASALVESSDHTGGSI